MREEEINEQGDEQEEPENYMQPMLDPSRRRAQAAPQACARVQNFQALSAAAMDACCPASGGGHRRLQASCDLPAACPSAACAAVFVPYMQDCAAMLAATPGVPVADFESFAASCAEMQAGAGQMLQPVAVQMFRVLVNTEGVAQAGAMSPGGGAGGGDGRGGNGLPLNSLQPVTPVPPRTIVTLMVDAGISTDLIIQPGERRGGGRRRWTQDRLTLIFCSGRGSVLRSTGDAAACLAMGALSRSHRCCLSGGRGQQPGS